MAITLDTEIHATPMETPGITRCGIAYAGVPTTGAITCPACLAARTHLRRYNWGNASYALARGGVPRFLGSSWRERP